ncbi:MAG: hypothetical protein V4510_02745 [bacterium]
MGRWLQVAIVLAVAISGCAQSGSDAGRHVPAAGDSTSSAPVQPRATPTESATGWWLVPIEWHTITPLPFPGSNLPYPIYVDDNATAASPRLTLQVEALDVTLHPLGEATNFVLSPGGVGAGTCGGVTLRLPATVAWTNWRFTARSGDQANPLGWWRAIPDGRLQPSLEYLVRDRTGRDVGPAQSALTIGSDDDHMGYVVGDNASRPGVTPTAPTASMVFVTGDFGDSAYERERQGNPGPSPEMVSYGKTAACGRNRETRDLLPPAVTMPFGGPKEPRTIALLCVYDHDQFSLTDGVHTGFATDGGCALRAWDVPPEGAKVPVGCTIRGWLVDDSEVQGMTQGDITPTNPLIAVPPLVVRGATETLDIAATDAPSGIGPPPATPFFQPVRTSTYKANLPSATGIPYHAGNLTVDIRVVAVDPDPQTRIHIALDDDAWDVTGLAAGQTVTHTVRSTYPIMQEGSVRLEARQAKIEVSWRQDVELQPSVPDALRPFLGPTVDVPAGFA